MDHKKAVAALAGALLALGTGSAAAAADTTAAPAEGKKKSAPDVAPRTGETPEVVTNFQEFNRTGTLSRQEETLVKGNPKRIGVEVAGIPLGIQSPD